MENIENNKIRIDPDIFRLLLQRIRVVAEKVRQAVAAVINEALL